MDGLSSIFASAEAKIHRAAVHLDELDAKTGDWLAGVADTQRIRLSKHVDAEKDEAWFLFPRDFPRPPEEFSLIVGDAVHNMRSALDTIAWSLVEFCGDAGGVDDKKASDIGFPIYLRSSEFEGEVDRKLPGVQPEFIDAVKSQQPFAAGGFVEDNPLWLLNRASKEDKHRRLNVGVLVMRDFTIDWPKEPELGALVKSTYWRRDIGEETLVRPETICVMATGLVGEPELHINREGPLVPAFGEGSLSLTPATLRSQLLPAVEGALAAVRGLLD